MQILEKSKANEVVWFGSKERSQITLQPPDNRFNHLSFCCFCACSTTLCKQNVKSQL